ncbi:protein-glutamate methylesterase/protein-glutamine glutaminase [Rhodobacter maris]|uniref:Protein-glutamate methylesterase/protein-glutamine glutaminase n=1 Tax=Rhodobacter maris TaxID=446682 RepID=A0A285RXE5_9RHOB|nr:chemotaxis response regulator protein-glutamate methylesterase [Rhodobacter maris]SOB98736.1 two-component system chemotaxis response regulator CheB [Rhodobacter maris]
MTPKRVLIVDDSPTIRALLRTMLAQDPRLTVVGEACDPFDAREKIKVLLPDVLTLDVEMPRMNGLEFLEKLMRLRPMPVVMISTETQKGSAAALEALSLGAVECIGKPSFDRLSDTFANLADLLVAAAGARLRGAETRARVAPATDFNWNGKIVLVGSSTGGVDALETLLSGYPRNCPPTLITQHMPEGFLASFARRLDTNMLPQVELARDGVLLAPGHVYLAPGGDYHLAVAGHEAPKCRLVASDKRNGHRPSVEVLFDSAVPLANRVVSVMLTGMGKDGAEAMVRLRRAGARCLAQDEATCVVFGMPRAAIELGAAERAVSIGSMSRAVLDLCSGNGRSAAQFSSVRRA